VNNMNLQTKKNDVLYTLCPNFISVSIDNIEQLYRYLIITYKEDTAYIIDLKTKETKEISYIQGEGIYPDSFADVAGQEICADRYFSKKNFSIRNNSKSLEISVSLIGAFIVSYSMEKNPMFVKSEIMNTANGLFKINNTVVSFVHMVDIMSVFLNKSLDLYSGIMDVLENPNDYRRNVEIFRSKLISEGGTVKVKTYSKKFVSVTVAIPIAKKNMKLKKNQIVEMYKKEKSQMLKYVAKKLKADKGFLNFKIPINKLKLSKLSISDDRNLEFLFILKEE
jgi:hypothetical protein